jgi:hypothetical protein
MESMMLRCTQCTTDCQDTPPPAPCCITHRQSHIIQSQEITCQKAVTTRVQLEILHSRPRCITTRTRSSKNSQEWQCHPALGGSAHSQHIDSLRMLHWSHKISLQDTFAQFARQTNEYITRNVHPAACCVCKVALILTSLQKWVLTVNYPQLGYSKVLNE